MQQLRGLGGSEAKTSAGSGNDAKGWVAKSILSGMRSSVGILWNVIVAGRAPDGGGQVREYRNER